MSKTLICSRSSTIYSTILVITHLYIVLRFLKFAFCTFLSLFASLEGGSMITFFVGFVILVVGGWGYSKLSTRLFQPSDKATPAYSKRDGMDFVPMGKW